MILQRVLRSQTGLRAVSSSPLPIRKPTQTRAAHIVPQLRHGKSFEENGVPNCLSPESFEMAWTQYQTFVTDKLNMLTTGTKDENVVPALLIGKYARYQSTASLFNYASMAHNNHIFFDGLSPQPVPVPDRLQGSIEDSCSSMESLRAEFIATANAMFGPGFVWLVKSKDTSNLSILATYLAGSPYATAHYRRQPVNMASQSGYPTSSRSYGSFGPHSSQSTMPHSVADVHPILCVNTWEHVWLRDWGVSGKEGFLEAWWDMIDWEAVDERAAEIIPRSPSAQNARKFYPNSVRF